MTWPGKFETKSLFSLQKAENKKSFRPGMYTRRASVRKFTRSYEDRNRAHQLLGLSLKLIKLV